MMSAEKPFHVTQSHQRRSTCRLFPSSWCIISQHRLRLAKHLKTSSAYHASQHEVLTSACLQLSAGAIFSQAFMRRITNHTNTHVTDTCAINFTNLYFSRACITLQCVARVKSTLTQNDWCSLWNQAYSRFTFHPCCQCKLGVFGVLFAQLTLICSNNGTGLRRGLFIGCQGLRSSRGSLGGYMLHHIHTARQKAAQLANFHYFNWFPVLLLPSPCSISKSCGEC